MALTADAVGVLYEALSNMLERKSDNINKYFRDVRVYNNGTASIDCDADPPVPWKQGHNIMKAIKMVGFKRKTPAVLLNIFFSRLCN